MGRPHAAAHRARPNRPLDGSPGAEPRNTEAGDAGLCRDDAGGLFVPVGLDVVGFGVQPAGESLREFGVPVLVGLVPQR